MKDEFLATLSHELRTPLNAVLGWSEVLLKTMQNSPDVTRGLEAIARNARAQAQLIDDLLDMSRIVAGQVRLDVQRTDLASVVEAAVDAVKLSADAKAIRLRAVVDPLAGPVFGDPSRLQQVVWNLLSNAVKFTPKAGKIDVIVARVNSHIEITVSDSGPGISPEFLPHVFERFRQADASTTRKHGGLGLGQDGYQFIREVRGLRTPQGKTPAIALTAFARSEDRTRALLAGYQIHLAKPIEPQELLATVASLVGRTARPKS